MEKGTETLETGVVTPNDEKKTAEANAAVVVPTYTPDQQEHFNKTVQTRLARQEAKLQDQFNAKLQDELKKLREELVKPPAKKTDEEDPDKAQARQLIEAEKAQTKLAEQAAKDLKAKLDASESRNSEILKKQSIERAMRERGFFNPDEVMLLTQHLIEQDEDGKYVVRENGTIKMNSSMEPMSLEEFFTNYAQARPYLVNANYKGGAGSSESTRNGKGQGSVASKADLKTAKAKSDYIEKFGLEAFEKLPLR